jgi:fic family protein
MPEHKVQRRKSIRFFNDLEMRAVWNNNHYEWWVSVLEIFVAINEQDDYQKTRNHWIFLRIKLKKEINELVSATNRFKLRFNNGSSAKKGRIYPKTTLYRQKIPWCQRRKRS